MFRHHFRYRSVLALLLAVLMLGLVPDEAEARQRGRRTGLRSRAASVQQRPAAKRSRGKSRRRVRVRTTPMTALKVVREREITEGLRYVEYRSNGSAPVVVHTLVYDRTVPGNALRVIKGHDVNDGLERLADMSRRYQTSSGGEDVLGIVNANFWRALRTTPIGPCVIDGEVVEMLSYKRWSSAFFDAQDRMAIDTFRISGTVRYGRHRLPIASVNRRVDSGVVVYNAFGGSTIPHVNARDIEAAYQDALRDSLVMGTDSTELALSQEQVRAAVMRDQQEANQEYPTVKIRIRYLRSPGINTDIPGVVMDVDTGSVDMPLRGCVIAVPAAILPGRPSAGDTVFLHYTTSTMTSTRFMNAVSGTPRLVRNGVAGHEAQLEGSTGRRFIQHNLARTAIGADRSGNKLYVVAIEPSQSASSSSGATLAQTAQIMKLLGTWNAMNLDGGGSSGMVVENDHVFFDGEDPLTRKLSVGLAVVRRSHVLRRTVEPRHEGDGTTSR